MFVFARAADGSRMPLAVQRARVADLPLQYRLDDSLAISPQARLSQAAEVRIEARVSRSGNATPGARRSLRNERAGQDRRHAGRPAGSTRYTRKARSRRRGDGEAVR